jgi:hypothetical protein
LVSGDRARFADNSYPGSEVARLLRVRIRLVRILGDAGGDEQPRYDVREVAWQRPQFGKRLGI